MMTFTQFLQNDVVTDSQKAHILRLTIQSLLDANYPGMRAERLSKEHIDELTMYVAENYNFRFLNQSLMNSIIAEPKSLINAVVGIAEPK